MVHTFKINGIHIALDVYSGSVHVLDETAYALLLHLAEAYPQGNKNHNTATAKDSLPPVLEDMDKLRTLYPNADTAYDEICELHKAGLLFTENDYPVLTANTDVVKAVCLHIAHDCNLRCAYCFADDGTYHGGRLLMDEATAFAAIDFLIANSGNRRNLEVDFFGGEPLMNFDVVKKTVEYARKLESTHNKRFRFTITTNGMLLDDKNMAYINEHMDNVVLSLDGREHINDKVRIRADGSGSYARVLPKIKQLADLREQDNYYVRGTYTAYNKDFTEDVLHLHDLGFLQISVEPVVCESNKPYALTADDLPKLYAEYEKLALEYVKRRKEGNPFNFFHFMIDLTQGPCVIKRVSGCGAGCEYAAITPEGDIYPCHQFAGMDEYKLGSVAEGITNTALRKKFANCNVFTKPECEKCFAKFYCGGGCIASAAVYGGDMNSPHKLSCELQRKRVECALYVAAMEA